MAGHTRQRHDSAERPPERTEGTTDQEHEQVVVDALYGRLDQLRERTAQRLKDVRRAGPSGSPQNRSERDAFAAMYEDQLARLGAVEDRLVFGRLDLRDGITRHIGRIGLSDDDRQQLLVDWRASAAEPFYRATAASPGDVVRRRHIATAGRHVTGIEDEALDLAAGPSADLTLNGEGALMAALAANRTGRMRDIVATIQAEQDRVVRAPLQGVLVVQGGPGTGKTAVALHRAAYLLYTHRDRLARSGVLLVGPSPVFLRYIEQVLPSLGETGVVMSTPGELFPGVVATAAEDPYVAAIKGDHRMAGVVRHAVMRRQRVPTRPVDLSVDGSTVVLEPRVVAQARARARRSRRPHNAARERFVSAVLDDLSSQLAIAQHVPLDDDTRPDLLAALRDSPDVRREVNLCWMPLTPQRLIADLWADDDALASTALHLSATERRLLRRDRGAPWTAADVPLLDEAAELLGEDESAARVEQRRRVQERAAEVEYARGALAMSGAGAFVSAERLADRFADSGPLLTLAERAAGDRTWAFGHVVVDEAQELSPMMWRLLMRRCPTRSMTVVGDIAQAAALSAPASWADIMDRYAGGLWHLEELTVNYRTPAEVMALASGMLSAAGVRVGIPRSARSGDEPVAVPAAAVDVDAVASVVRSELTQLGGGRLAVIVPRTDFEDVRHHLAALLPSGTTGVGPNALEAPVIVLDVGEAKGLEFDVVVLVEPGAVLSQSARGANDLYVALTRPTRRLVVVHAQSLPAGMEALMERAA